MHSINKQHTSQIAVNSEVGIDLSEKFFSFSLSWSKYFFIWEFNSCSSNYKSFSPLKLSNSNRVFESSMS